MDGNQDGTRAITPLRQDSSRTHRDEAVARHVDRLTLAQLAVPHAGLQHTTWCVAILLAPPPIQRQTTRSRGGDSPGTLSDSALDHEITRWRFSWYPLRLSGTSRAWWQRVCQENCNMMSRVGWGLDGPAAGRRPRRRALALRSKDKDL